MTKFLKHITFLTFLLVCIMCTLDLFISHNLKKSHNFQGEIEVWNDIYEGKINTDIAIYGSSRAWTQINPSILKSTLHQNVYNFGVDGHNFWIQYLRHKEYLKHNIKPKIILLNVDIFTFEKRKDLYQLEQFLPYALWNNQIRKYTASYKGFKKIDYYVPFFRYAGKTKAIKNAFYNFKNKDTITYRNSGYKSFDLKWGKKEGLVNKIDEYVIKLDKNSIELFELFLEECKELNIKIILTYTPEHKEGQNKVSNRDKVVKLYRKFSNKYSIPFLNYSKDSLLNEKKYFYNSMHLNKKGSFVLSHKIANDLQKLLSLKNLKNLNR